MTFKDRPYFRRILDLDELLREGKPVTTRILASRWETSTKTVQRFLDTMRDEFGAPIEFERAQGSYRYTDPSWHLPWIPVKGVDLFAIGIAAKVFQIYEGTPVADDLRGAFERLAEVMPEEVKIHPSSLVERLYIHPQPLRVVDRAVWNAVATSLREKTTLEVLYQKPGDEARRREIEPYTLVLSQGDWFVAARDPEDGVVKTFYLSRIREARHTVFRYAVPKDFDAARHFGETIGIYVGGESFRFRVRFSREIAPWVAEVRWHPRQELTPLPTGEVELELPAGSPVEAKRFVLSFGKEAQALAPAELVEAIRIEVRAMAAAAG